MGRLERTGPDPGPERARAVRRRPNGPQPGLYASRTARVREPHATAPVPADSERTRRLRELARAGSLARTAGAATAAELAQLTSDVYDFVWPIVFAQVTRRQEYARGHPLCAAGVDRLTDDCLDRFHEDVEAVIGHLMHYARGPIVNLEAWVAVRLTAATVDGHRRRRGLRGALQRPRLPGWLSTELGHDPWLIDLALRMLEWAGLRVTAGNEVWPVGAWAHRRAVRTGDWQHSGPDTVAGEIRTVQAAMLTRPDWYQKYVERPLGAKQAPVAMMSMDEIAGEAAMPLDLGEPDALLDAEMRCLAAAAVASIDSRVSAGEDTREVVVDVIGGVFGGAVTGGLDRPPHNPDPLGGVTVALTDDATIDRIVREVRAILRSGW